MSIREKAIVLARGVLRDELADLHIEIGRLRAENERIRRACDIFEKNSADAAALFEENRKLAAERDRLRAENAEYWRAASAIAQALTDEDHNAALTKLNEIRLGNGYAHVPEPVVAIALRREAELSKKLLELVRQACGYQAELAEVEQTLGAALGYPVAGPEIGGAGTGVMVGEHTPATLAAEAARELELLRERVKFYGDHLYNCRSRSGYKCSCGFALERRAGEGG